MSCIFRRTITVRSEVGNATAQFNAAKVSSVLSLTTMSVSCSLSMRAGGVCACVRVCVPVSVFLYVFSIAVF